MYLYKQQIVYVLTAVVHYVDDQAHVYGYVYVPLMCIPTVHYCPVSLNALPVP